jgi:hypothetical protein
MSYGSTPYTVPPPNYDVESNQPLLGANADDDMYKETVANSSKEVRLRKYFHFFLAFFLRISARSNSNHRICKKGLFYLGFSITCIYSLVCFLHV